jgi:CheY-like chemotaxis protein
MRKYQRILLVDDDPASVYIHRTLLEELSLAHQIDVKENGEAAFRYLQALAQQPGPKEAWPQVILLDLHMPGKDGFEFLQASRQAGLFEKQATSIIIVTSSNHLLDQWKAAEFGLVDFLTKPLTVPKLVSAFSKLEVMNAKREEQG